MKFKVLAGALLFILSFGAFAQHDHGQTQAKPPADPAMEAMMKAATPGDAHKLLNHMTGTFTAKMTMWMKPGEEPMVVEGTSESKWVMGGRYVEQRFSSNFMGMPYEGLGYTGYDNVKKQYWGTWMDNMSTSMMTSTGGTNDGGKSWSFTASMADPMTGKDSRVEEKITIADADHQTFEMWGAGPDGKMFKTMEIVYTRKK